jgi:uncharacterized protein DUF6165
MPALQAPLSVGELIDKITILEIKSERIADAGKLANIRHELTLLRGLQAHAGLTGARMDAFAAELKAVNVALWEIEDAIREQEAAADFGARFVELARAVYRNNDRRAAIKRAINLGFGSEIVEEKSYKGFSV